MTYSTLATQIADLTEALRLSTYDPADQIRLLCSLAEFRTETAAPSSDDPIGIAGLRAAGPSNRWASTSRNTPASYADGDGIIRYAAARQLRPAYANGKLSGYVIETSAATNLQNSSTRIVSGTNLYAIGPNAVDGGMVTAPDGTRTARRITSGPSGPGNVYLSRWSNTSLTVAPSTTYTISVWVRREGGAPFSIPIPTIDEYNSTPGLVVRTQNTVSGLPDVWTRYSRTITTTATTRSIQVYWGADWPVGGTIDVWGCQVEAGSTATSLIATPATGSATRAADVVSIVAPAAPAPAAIGSAKAAAATASLCRRAALASLARAVAAYAPASTNEASATLRRVRDLYDAEIGLAGDAGDDAAYTALRALRSAVLRDLQARGLLLPEIITVQRAGTQPALVAAHALYQNAYRADEMMQRARVRHPLFFPPRFEALSPG